MFGVTAYEGVCPRFRVSQVGLIHFYSVDEILPNSQTGGNRFKDR